MAVTLPKILVTFTQLATSFIQRSARGIAVLIVRDDTAGTGKTFFQYGDATQVSDTEFTPANQQYIKDALSFGPLRVSVVKIKTADDLAAAAAIFTQYEKDRLGDLRGGEQRRLVGPYQLDQGPGSGVQELEGRLLQGHGAGLHAHRQPQQ